MPRFIILGVVLAIAFTLYSLVDAAMTDARRARGVSKPVWVVICVLLPVIGGILWLTVGKGDGSQPAQPVRPDDDPRFGAMSSDKVDERIADLEQQLRALDDEVFPGESAENTAVGERDTGESDASDVPPSADDTPPASDDSSAVADDSEDGAER